ADLGDLDRALETAARGFKIWRHASAAERAPAPQAAARLSLDRADDIARTAPLEQGKPLAEARMEVAMVANLFNFSAGETQRLYGRALVRPYRTRATVV